jgi:hypothetical protein
MIDIMALGDSTAPADCQPDLGAPVDPFDTGTIVQFAARERRLLFIDRQPQRLPQVFIAHFLGTFPSHSLLLSPRSLT